MEHTSVGAGPIEPERRIVLLDALRGLALYGVLLVNLVEDFRVSLFSYLLSFHTDAGTWNRVADLAIAVLVDQKAMVVFSLLFGIGLGLQRERLRRSGDDPMRRLARRYVVLLGVGAVHITLVWTGDILTLYAIAALIVTPLLALPARRLAGVGLLLLLWWASPYPPPALPFPWHDSLSALAEQSGRIYGSGSLPEVLVFRFHELRSGIIPLLVSVLPRTVGLFLIGAAVSERVRSGNTRVPVGLTAGCLAVGIFGAACDALVAEGLLDLGRFRGCVGNASTLLMGFGYFAAFTTAMQNPRFRAWAQHLAPMGRMVLTNYLVQSFVCITIFYGIGLGAMNHLGSALATLIATAIFMTQAWVSSAWLRRRRFGPVEWMWRRLTYGAALKLLEARTPHTTS